MSAFLVDVSDPATVNLWEGQLDREVRAKDPLLDDESGLAGAGQGSLLQIRDDLNSEAGSHIRTKIRYQLKGRGRGGEEVLKGHEEDYKFATDNVYVNVLRHAFNVGSPMAQQFVKEDVMNEGRDGLADWMATRLSLSLHAHAAGIGLITEGKYTLHNTIQAVNSSYIIRPNGKAAGALVAGDEFDTDLLNDVAQFVKNVRPKLRPASTPWGPRFCVFLHPDQVKSLRASNTTWFGNMRAAMAGGRIDDNPIFTRALGEDQGFLFFESDFVPPGLNSGETAFKASTRRAWIGGAQALTMAFGRGYRGPGFDLNRYQWLRDSEDYQHQNAIAVATIVGAKRPRYTHPDEASARELGIVVVETYADLGTQTAAQAYVDWTDASGASIEA